MNTDTPNKTKLVAGAMAILAVSLGVTTSEQPANALPAVQAGTGIVTSNQIKSHQLKSSQFKINLLKSNMVKSNMLKSNLLKTNQLKSNQLKNSM